MKNFAQKKFNYNIYKIKQNSKKNCYIRKLNTELVQHILENNKGIKMNRITIPKKKTVKLEDK